MKIIIKTLIIFLLFMPFIIKAEQYTYSGAITRANNYINNYDTRSKYILFGSSYEFNGTIVPNNTFVNGGLLNKVEYEVGGRYLSPGAEYWTMTSVPNSSYQYTISNILRSEKTMSDKAGVRVTEYVKPDASVTGNGTKAHPWEFKESYIVYIGSNDVNKGTISDNEIHVVKNGNATLTLYPKYAQGYRYKVSTCGLSFDSSTGVATLRNITKDINCLVIFDNQIYTFNLTDTNAQVQANPTSLILEYRNGWFSDTNLAHSISQITVPKRTGYRFKGYKFGSIDVIDQNGNILRTVEPTSLTTLNYNLTAQWEAIEYTCSAGTYLPKNSINCEPCKVGSYCSSGTFTINLTEDQGITSCPSGYTSAAGTSSENRCYISIGDGKYLATANSTTQTACPAGTAKSSHTVYYGSTSSCDTCTTGTYSTGGAKQCSSCPSGYTSDSGATAQNRCYINVSGGKYLATANSTTQTSCPAGTYNPAHKVNYGSTSSCSDCNAGSYSTGGATTCTTCPSGYTSAAKATAENKCYINVGDGKYIATAKSSTQTNCPAGSAKAAHTVYYGSTSSCGTCSAGTYSDAGAKQCSSCPSGYTSAAGASGITRCYVTIGAGKYKTSATGTGTASCGGGTYKTQHNSYYNSGDSCDGCPSGYTSGSGATASTSCYMNVPAGKYKTSSTGSGTANCGGGTYIGAHTSYYGSGDSCASCPSGYTSGSGATASTSCYMGVPAGQYKNNAWGSSTAYCGAGTYSGYHTSYYGSGDSCSGCPGGQTSNAGASSCFPCNRWVLSNPGAALLNQKWEYYYSNCTKPTNAWIYTGASESQPDNDGAKWWFYIEGGYMKVGWHKDGNTWYYLYAGPTTYNGNYLSGRMVTGNGSSCQTLPNGERHVFRSDGAWVRQC